MKHLKVMFALAACALSLAAYGQSTQSSKYSPVSISLPMTTLAAATSTNLASGWTTTTYSTNRTVTFDSSSAAFVTNSVITTNTSTTYANFAAPGAKSVGLQFEFNASGSTTTNLDVTIARSVTGVNYDTVNNQTFSFAFNGTTGVVGITNLDMSGFAFGRVVTVFNRDATRIYTNAGAYYGVGYNRP